MSGDTIVQSGPVYTTEIVTEGYSTTIEVGPPLTTEINVHGLSTTVETSASFSTEIIVDRTSTSVDTVEYTTAISTDIAPRGPEGPAGVLNLVVEANCLAGDAVDDCVCITGPSVAGKYQVRKADPTDAAKMPAVGMIVSKSSATECMVMLAGMFPVGGLTPGKLHFVGTSGTLTATCPTPSGSPVLVQAMGKAIDSNRLALLPASHITRLIP